MALEITTNIWQKVNVMQKKNKGLPQWLLYLHQTRMPTFKDLSLEADMPMVM